MTRSLLWWRVPAPESCYLSQWAGGGLGCMAAVDQCQDKHEVAPSTRCYRRINYSRHEWSSGIVNVSQRRDSG